MTTTPIIATDLLDMLAANTDDALDDAANALADDIIDLADALTTHDMHQIMLTIRLLDPTFSTIAALIRDALRDNTNFKL